MNHYTREDAVRILTNLDGLSASAIPDARRAWAHTFIAIGLIQKTLPNPDKLSRERWLQLAGSVYDKIYASLEGEFGPQA